MRSLKVMGWVEVLFNVTINDISVIYVTAHRCAGGLKKSWTYGRAPKRHRHFVGFFNEPVQAPTRDQPFYTVIRTHRPQLVAFYDTLGIRMTHSRLDPRDFTGKVIGQQLSSLSCQPGKSRRTHPSIHSLTQPHTNSRVTLPPPTLLRGDNKRFKIFIKLKN